MSVESSTGKSFILVMKYRWLVNYLKRNACSNYDDITARFREKFGEDLPRRTFDNMKAMLLKAGFHIKYQKTGRSTGCYRIVDIGEPERADEFGDALRDLLTEDYKYVKDVHNIQDRIIYEDIPSKNDFFDQIIGKIERNETLTFEYKSFRTGVNYNYTVEPYALKLFKRRWYLLGNHITRPEQNPDLKYVPRGMWSFSLDRILNITSQSKKFSLPNGYEGNKFFEDYFGVITTDKGEFIKPSRIRLKVYTNNHKHLYIESLPIHQSQRIVERNDDYWIFEYNLAVSFDLIQEILMQREDIEVLEPEKLRASVKEALQKTLERYDNSY